MWKTVCNFPLKLQLKWDEILKPDEILKVDQVLKVDEILKSDQILKVDEVLNAEEISKVETGNDSIYDPRFVLPFLMNLLRGGEEMNCRRLIEGNFVALGIVALGSHSAPMRNFGYAIMELFRQRIRESKAENFCQKSEILFILNLMKNSVEKKNDRIPFVIAIFFANLMKIALNPDPADPMRQKLLKFASAKFFFRLENLPVFEKIFYSNDFLNSQNERDWLLDWLLIGLKEPKDFRVAEKQKIMQIFFSQFDSPIFSAKQKIQIRL